MYKNQDMQKRKLCSKISKMVKRLKKELQVRIIICKNENGILASQKLLGIWMRNFSTLLQGDKDKNSSTRKTLRTQSAKMEGSCLQ